MFMLLAQISYHHGFVNCAFITKFEEKKMSKFMNQTVQFGLLWVFLFWLNVMILGTIILFYGYLI